MKLLQTIIAVVFTVLDEVFQLLSEVIMSIFSSFQNQTGKYEAEFMPRSNLLSRFEHGFCLDGVHSLSVSHSTRNALIVGGTGTGKTSCVLIPSVYKAKGHSLVIHDPSGEIHQYTGWYLKNQGYDIKVVNFSDPSTSIRFNVLQRIQSSTEINKVASMLIRNTLGYGSGDQFWNLQATGLMTLMITILKDQEPKYQNFANLKFLLSEFASDPESLDQLFIRAKEEATFNEYRVFAGMDSKLRSSVTATAKASLTHLSDESILQVTSKDELDIESFRKKKTALFICNSVMDSSYFSTLTSLLLEEFYSMLLRKLPDKSDLHVLFLIDELPTLFMPSLPTVIANVRKAHAGILAICQDQNQLSEKYGVYEAEVIRNNCFAQVYFPGQGLHTARELEQILGKHEVQDHQGHVRIRPLLTSDEIRILPDNRALLICSNKKPIKLKMRPFYKRRKYLRYANMPAPSPVRPHDPFEDVPILDLNQRPVENEG